MPTSMKSCACSAEDAITRPLWDRRNGRVRWLLRLDDTVLESEKMAYISVTDQHGRSCLLREPINDQQIIDYKAHPESYFGKLQYVGKGVNTPYELFEFLMDSHKGLSRVALLDRLAGHIRNDLLAAMSEDDLLATYCEELVAVSNMNPSSGILRDLP